MAFDLERFVSAQDPVYSTVLSELRSGQKRTHWMWFMFPQLAGLGHSHMAQLYAISSLDEARAYLEHTGERGASAGLREQSARRSGLPAEPGRNVLGARLRECTALVNAIQGREIGDIFGYPDDLKFHSSMTLFARASDGEQVFKDALAKYFSGKEDQATVTLLA